ncbi:MAG: RluA family pseudouridine synthase [Deltaproteobacteria bacterium]|nr:RluA family pseudouridine synthase [Deltaproteobacteria bacterium]
MGHSLEKTKLVTSETAGAVQKIVRAMTCLPNTTVRGLFGHQCVWIDGEVCTEPGFRVESGMSVMVRYDPDRNYREKSKPKPNRAFRLVFEDTHLVVVEKFAGVLTVPNKGERDTLVDYLATYLKRGSKAKARPLVVHRLDRETSGLLVLCKHREAAEAIKSQFRARKPERVYIALAAGTISKSSGTVQSYLTTDPLSLNQYSTRMKNLGKLAVTHYEVVHRVAGATVLKVTLETGRRNQIRVHFAEMGHPLLGDPRYRPEAALHPLWKGRHIALHAALLGFDHPVTGKSLRFVSPLPEEFTPFLPQGFSLDLNTKQNLSG